MNVQSLKKQLAEKEFVLKSIMVLEDGYVMRCKIVEKDFEDDAEYEMYVESAIDRIYAINFDGFIVSEILIERDVFAITLFPKSL